MVGMDKYVYGCPLFWLGLLLVPTTALLSDIAIKAFRRTVHRSMRQEVQDFECQNSCDTYSVFRNGSSTRRKNYTQDNMRVFVPSRSDDTQEPTESHGYAFSQEEDGVVEQSDLIRVYDTTQEKPSGL